MNKKVKDLIQTKIKELTAKLEKPMLLGGLSWDSAAIVRSEKEALEWVLQLVDDTAAATAAAAQAKKDIHNAVHVLDTNHDDRDPSCSSCGCSPADHSEKGCRNMRKCYGHDLQAWEDDRCGRMHRCTCKMTEKQLWENTKAIDIDRFGLERAKERAKNIPTYYNYFQSKR